MNLDTPPSSKNRVEVIMYAIPAWPRWEAGVKNLSHADAQHSAQETPPQAPRPSLLPIVDKIKNKK